jgi:hypothetical protein
MALRRVFVDGNVQSRSTEHNVPLLGNIPGSRLQRPRMIDTTNRSACQMPKTAEPKHVHEILCSLHYVRHDSKAAKFPTRSGCVKAMRVRSLQ